MKKYLLLIPLLVSFACGNSPELAQVETLHIAEREAHLRNLHLYGQIANGVEDLGRADFALVVLGNAQKALEIRKAYGLDIPLEETSQNFTPENVKAYLEEMNRFMSTIPDRNSEQRKYAKNQLVEFEKRTIELLEKGGGLSPHYVLLNLLFMEKVVLNEFAEEIGHN